MDVQRVHPLENTNIIAAAQIRALVARLPAAAATPLFVFDAGYDPLQLALELGETPAAILVRLRRGRCFYADPAPYGGVGRPRRHGRKFACDDQRTWPAPSDERCEMDAQYGSVRVRAWAGLHAKPGQSSSRPLRAQKPVVPGTLILVAVSRLPGRPRQPQVLSLAGAVATRHGPVAPDRPHIRHRSSPFAAVD